MRASCRETRGRCQPNWSASSCWRHEPPGFLDEPAQNREVRTREARLERDGPDDVVPDRVARALPRRQASSSCGVKTSGVPIIRSA